MAVQANIIKYLLFMRNTEHTHLERLHKIRQKEQGEALAAALADSLWAAGDGRRAAVCILTAATHCSPPAGYKADSFTERINLFEFPEKAAAQEFIFDHIGCFRDEGSHGLILFLYSLLFSRTLKRVREELGATAPQLLECSSGNVTCTQVGSMLKTPKFPIWLCSINGTHSVLFSTNRLLLSDWKMEHIFHLYFYTGQCRQTRTAHLTIGAKCPQAPALPRAPHTFRTMFHFQIPTRITGKRAAARPRAARGGGLHRWRWPSGPSGRGRPSDGMARSPSSELPLPPPPHPPPAPGLSGPGGPVSPQHHELTSLFECPVCFDYVLPPILQCQAGHLVCKQCRQKLSLCPTCRGSLTPSIRNLAMEKVASAVLFPCKYATTGCSLTLHHTEKPEHEDICEYRPYSCPCPGASCKWQGSLEAVMSHLMHAHKSITTLQGEDIVFLATDINLPGAVDWVMMQSCFGHHFMLVLEKQEKYEGHQQFFAIVLLIGTRKQAENFAYRLELNGNRRRLTWEATPRSIHDGVNAAIVNSDCLVFDTAIAHLFADNGNLGINVTISTCCP
ncbi:E3 ubiquitin-protein ligase SIAH2 [Meleagris gallopavo]|nr:E3 ubiquitin-protein ligase SIAH2 [Meleagris gallopavo]